MSDRKVEAIDIAIGVVGLFKARGCEEERGKRDVIAVLGEAKAYFKEQGKPKEKTIADDYPSGYREPLCTKCPIYEEIKEEVAGPLLDACEELVWAGSGNIDCDTHAIFEKAKAAIAKAKGKPCPPAQ